MMEKLIKAVLEKTDIQYADSLAKFIGMWATGKVGVVVWGNNSTGYEGYIDASFEDWYGERSVFLSNLKEEARKAEKRNLEKLRQECQSDKSRNWAFKESYAKMTDDEIEAEVEKIVKKIDSAEETIEEIIAVKIADTIRGHCSAYTIYDEGGRHYTCACDHSENPFVR